MSVSNRLEVVEGIGEYRMVGPHGFQQAVKDIAAAIVSAREQELRSMLVVTTGASGFDPPGIVERHAMVRCWALAADGVVKIAIVAPPGFIDPEKFGVIAAANFGLLGNVFSSEGEARAWLRE